MANDADSSRNIGPLRAALQPVRRSLSNLGQLIGGRRESSSNLAGVHAQQVLQASVATSSKSAVNNPANNDRVISELMDREAMLHSRLEKWRQISPGVSRELVHMAQVEQEEQAWWINKAKEYQQQDTDRS